MLSQEELTKYINDIPPIPSILKECKMALSEGDMVKAADIASKDRALMAYFEGIVNKPIFGFRDELKNARQIFGALGIVRARQMFRSYYSSLLMPKKWEIFNMNDANFHELQASFIVRWEAILQQKDVNSEEMTAIVTLIPAAIAVCESIFKAHKDTIDLIKSQKAITYEAILYKLSGYNFFDIVSIIAKKWEFHDDIIELFSVISKNSTCSSDDEKKEMMIYLLLLINYELSRPDSIKSGINDLFEVDCEFPEEAIEFFYEVMNEVEE